jgi:hypothetical protein
MDGEVVRLHENGLNILVILGRSLKSNTRVISMMVSDAEGVPTMTGLIGRSV